MFVHLNGDGRVMISAEENCFPDMVQRTEPEGFDRDHQDDWRDVEGELIFDPLPKEKTPPTDRERIEALEEELAAAKILLGVE